MDDVEEVEFLSRTPERHRDAAATLTSWAAEPHPDDDPDVTAAQLLSAAAWHLGQAGELEESLALYRRAVADGGACTIDARVQLAGALLQAGREDEARQVAAEFRRTAQRLADLAMMAEEFEMAGDLREAHRLVNIGVNRLQLAPEIGSGAVGGFDLEQLLRARRRIREALGYPPDDLDETAR
jgi:hypothetical protein